MKNPLNDLDASEQVDTLLDVIRNLLNTFDPMLIEVGTHGHIKKPTAQAYRRAKAQAERCLS